MLTKNIQLHNSTLDTDRHNLRSFFAASSAQNYFPIARMLSFFCDIRDKSAIFNILRQNMTIFDIGNLIEREEIKRKWENEESECLSISSFSLHFLLIFSFSLHFLTARLPGCHKLWNPSKHTFKEQRWSLMLLYFPCPHNHNQGPEPTPFNLNSLSMWANPSSSSNQSNYEL